MTKLFLLFFTIFGLSVLPFDFAWAVGNGRRVDASDWIAKRVVAIHYRSGAINEMCTGTVLGPRHLLTAAHCFVTAATRELRAKEKFKVLPALNVSAFMLGSDDRDVTPIALEDYRLVTPVSKMGTPGDVAVVTLKRALPRGYVAVRLEEKDVVLAADLVVAGYGLTSSGSATLRGTHLNQGLLYSSPVPQNDEAEVFDAGQSSFFIHMNSRFDQSSCSGDSGGPIFRLDGRDGVQVGIVHGTTNQRGSHLGKCPNEENYATKVVPYLAWIQAALKAL